MKMEAKLPAFPKTRLRRPRLNRFSRRLVQENQLTVSDLIWNIIISDGPDPRDPVPSLPGVDRVNIDEAVKDARRALSLGIPAIALFPHIESDLKDPVGTEALNPEGLVPRTIRAIKSEVPELGIIVDVALDPFTDHGHDGVIAGDEIINDITVEALADGAIILADAGADIVAPSDMMDGRVAAIRQRLDQHGHHNVMIMSYAAKYASGFYGPYRDAIGTSAVLKGDKRTYQMDPANSNEALREIALDIEEGADMVMIKPGMPYLDIIYRIKSEFMMPTFAFQVSGEAAMIRAAAENGWIDEKRVILESLISFKRAGCDGVLTYFAPNVAEWINED
ncbi:MAG: porphobilinogen synthase [Hellea sp.]|nr:porphobilinogen synthase [Hellea sp.]